MRNNLFLQVSELIKSKQKIQQPKNISVGNNLNTNPINLAGGNNSPSMAFFEEMNRRVSTLQLLVENLPNHIIDGVDVYAYNNNIVAVSTGRILFNGAVLIYDRSFDLPTVDSTDLHITMSINTNDIGIKYLIAGRDGERATVRLTQTPSPTDVLIAKIVINDAGGLIEDDANPDRTNNYIVSGKDLALNPQFRIDDDTKFALRNVLTELMAENIIGELKLNSNLTISNQQNSVVLDSTSLKILTDGIRLAEFNRDGVYFYNEDQEMLSQYTKDGATVGQIRITPNSLESLNFKSGSNGFQINSDGNVEFNNVVARGTIYGRAGKIGGVNIANQGLYVGVGSFDSSDTGFYLDSAGKFSLSDKFSWDGSDLSLTGSITATSGSFTGSVTATSGTIGGWDIQSGLLRSVANSTDSRIELNKTLNRVSIFSGSDENVVMGYLSGLPKNDGSGDNWTGSDYGFWARQSTNLVIDGDIEYDSGDWIVGSHASIQIGKPSYTSSTAGIWMGYDISDYKVNIGSAFKYLKWTGEDLELRGNIVASKIEGRTVSEDTMYLSYQFTNLINDSLVATDSSLNGNNGTIEGNAIVVAGIFGNGMGFNNGGFSNGFSNGFSKKDISDTYIETNYAYDFSTDISIVFWCKFRDIIQKSLHGHKGTLTNLYIGCENSKISVGVGNNEQTDIYHVDGDEYVCIGLGVDVSESEYHVYYNGVLVYNGSYTNSDTSLQNIVFGGVNTSTGVESLLYGHMAEIKVYESLLTDDEFAILYTSPTGTGIYIDTSAIFNGSLSARDNINCNGMINSIKTVSSDYQLINTDYTILIDATSNTVTITLPDSIGTGTIYKLKCINATNTVTIDRNGKLIDNTASNITLSVNDIRTLQADSSNNWWII